MDVILQKITFYNSKFTTGDPRTKGWFLVDSFAVLLFLDFLYLVVVWIGPKLMQNRPPFQLKWILIAYNFSAATLNLHITYEVITAAHKLGYSYECEPCRISYDPDEMRVVKGVWLFYVAKYLELADTFFFILRKKQNQLSFLHVFHHAAIIPLVWIAAKYSPSGSSFVVAAVNGAIHVIMYSYYGLSAFGPGISKYLTWKKYITVLQLAQFIVLLVFHLNEARINCDNFAPAQLLTAGYMIVFLFLFGKFYIKTYNELKNDKTVSKAL